MKCKREGISLHIEGEEPGLLWGEGKGIAGRDTVKREMVRVFLTYRGRKRGTGTKCRERSY